MNLLCLLLFIMSSIYQIYYIFSISFAKRKCVILMMLINFALYMFALIDPNETSENIQV